MSSAEEEALELFQSVMRQKEDALKSLAEHMKKEGKFSFEYVICDNWQEVLDSLDSGKLVGYRCWAMNKLVLQTYLTEGE